MAFSVSGVAGLPGAKRGAGHRGAPTSMSYVDDSPEREPISAPGTACLVVVSVLVICGGIVLLCLGYIGYEHNKGEAANALKITGPIVLTLGMLGVIGGCTYASVMKRKQGYATKDRPLSARAPCGQSTRDGGSVT